MVAVGPIETGRPCYRVTLRDGASVVVDAEHEWLTCTKADRRALSRRTPEFRAKRRMARSSTATGQRAPYPRATSDRACAVAPSGGEIRTTREIADTLLLTNPTNHRDYSNHSIDGCCVVDYQEVPQSIPPYVLGAWLGDGSAASACMASADPEIIDRIVALGIPARKARAEYLYILGEKNGHRNAFSTALRALGVLGNKHIPTHYLIASELQRLELLRGLMDTDGYIDTKGHCVFTNTNKVLVDGFAELCLSLGIRVSVTESRAMLYGKDCGPVWDVWFVTTTPVCHLRRKAERQKTKIGKSQASRYIVSVDAVTSVPVRCIQVDSPSNLYLSGRGFIPTHNSTIAEKILLPHVLALPLLRKEKFFTEEGRPVFIDSKSKPRDPHFVIFGPNYKESRIEFGMLEDDLRALGKLANERHMSKPSDGPWRLVTSDGVVVQTWSLENPDSCRGINPEGALVVETGGVVLTGLQNVRGRVAATRGFVVYNGTLEESSVVWKEWQQIGKRDNLMGIKTYIIPTWANLHEFPGGKQDDEFLSWSATLGEDLFLERCAAVARPPRFRVLKEVTEKHVQWAEVPDDAEREIWIDPGYATAYAVLFVAIWKDAEGSKRFHVYDEVYEQRKDTRDVIEICKTKPFWGSVREGVLDVSAKRHADANTSSLEIWKKLTGINFYMKFWHEDRLIERVQSSAKAMQFTIDPKCRGLLMECGLDEPVFPEMGVWKFMTDRDGRIISEKPQDKNNHSSKALGYGLLKHLGQVESRKKPTSWNRLRQKRNPSA